MDDSCGRGRSRWSARGRRLGVALVAAGILSSLGGCWGSDAGSVNLAASKAVAEEKGLAPGGGGGKKSAGPKRGAAAPKSAPQRPIGRP